MAARGFDPYEPDRLRDIFEGISDAAKYDDASFNPITPERYGFGIKGFNPSDFATEEDYQQYLEGSTNQGPAMLTDRPTSSTDAGRPRTVAAGYQPYVGTKKGGTAYEEQLGKMTVMFRDGSLYNYYDVSPGEWMNFKASISKGAPWLNRGFPNGKQQVDGLFVGKPQGPADLSQASEAVRRNIYSMSRTAQVTYATKRAVTIDVQGNPRTYKSSAGYVSRAGAKRGRMAINGKNPSKGGKNPNQP